MKFNYVKFKNFLSYGDDIYTIPLSTQGITLITGYNKKDGGSNGSGKSTAVVESVVYALFGQTTKRLRAEQVVNNKIKKDCFVEISFDINQNHYLIRRYRNHGEMGNSLIFEKDGMDLSQEKLRETQRLIESTIKISFKSFILSIVLSQEKMAGFAENDPIERRKIIENLLMYDFISRYHKATKEILRMIRPETESLRRTHKDKKDTIDTLASNLLNYVEKWEADESRKKSRIEELREELKEWKKINPSEEIKQREDLAKKIREKEGHVAKKEEFEDSLISATSSLQRLETKLNAKLEEIDEINENPENCPVCGSSIKDDIFQNYLSKRLAEKDELEEYLEMEESNIKDLNTKIRRYTRKIEKNTEEISSLNEEIYIDLSDEEVHNLQEKITSAESEIKVLESQVDQNIEEDDYIANTQKKIEEVKTEAKRIRSKIRKLEDEQTHYEWWRDGLGNSPNSMKSFCVNHVLKSLNKYINYYLGFFGYDVSYNLTVELEDEIIKDGEEVSFNQLSGGEKRSVEISLLFALYEIVRIKMPDNINIMVLDEILSNYLDDVRITGALELLNELEERKLSIFVIDHRNLIKENLDCRVINATKDKDGFSRLELDSHM
jgi:DNA repair exonuclease SbcCD ATPase subunit